MTLSEFLAARLDEDEATAKHATPGPWAWEATGEKDNSWAVGLVQDEDENTLSGQIDAGDGIIIDGVCEGIDGNLADADHVARHDPARVLREVEAGRAIVHRCTALMNEPDEYPNGLVSPRAVLARQVLMSLAAVWSDHPDYDEAWRP